MSRILKFENFVSRLNEEKNDYGLPGGQMPKGFVGMDWKDLAKKNINAKNISYNNKGWQSYDPGTYVQVSELGTQTRGIASDKEADYGTGQEGILLTNPVLYNTAEGTFWFGQPMLKLASLDAQDDQAKGIYGEKIILTVPFDASTKDAIIVVNPMASGSFANPALATNTKEFAIDLIRAMANIGNPASNKRIAANMEKGLSPTPAENIKINAEKVLKKIAEVAKFSERISKNQTGKMIADTATRLMNLPAEEMKQEFAIALFGNPKVSGNIESAFDNIPWKKPS